MILPNIMSSRTFSAFSLQYTEISIRNRHQQHNQHRNIASGTFSMELASPGKYQPPTSARSCSWDAPEIEGWEYPRYPSWLAVKTIRRCTEIKVIHLYKYDYYYYYTYYIYIHNIFIFCWSKRDSQLMDCCRIFESHQDHQEQRIPIYPLVN